MSKECIWCKSVKTDYSLKCDSTIGENFEYHKCSKCKSLYISPLPKEEILKKAYESDYYGDDPEKKFAGPLEMLRNYLAGRRATKLAAILPHKARILDIGCGNGSFLKEMQKYGEFELFGSELPGPAAERAKKHKGVKIFTGDIDEDLKKHGFDMISLFHVFEHLQNPVKELKNIAEMLKRGGILIISMPEPESTQSAFFRKHWFHLDPPRHICLISRKSFTEKAEELKLNAVKSMFFSAEQNPYGFIQSWLNMISAKRELMFETLKGNSPLPKRTKLFVMPLHFALATFLLPISFIAELIDVIRKKSATYTIVLKKE